MQATTESFLKGKSNVQTTTVSPEPSSSTSYRPRFAQSTTDALRSSNRRILVTGSPGTGKTTFSISASRHAGDTIPAATHILCSDVAVLQGDHEGVAGAWGAGFEPAYVYDFASEVSWTSYKRRLVEALGDLRPICGSQIKYLVVDLALPNRLIQESVDPSVQKDWKMVAKIGAEFFACFGGLPGVTVIGNAQLKAATGIGESMQAADAANARAVGGERSTYMSDLYKGVGSVWVDNCSLQITRQIQRKKVDKEIVPVYSSHTQSNMKYEAKSRFRNVLAPTEDGNKTLHSLLVKAYGDTL